MVEKIKAALAARRDPNLVLIARTNARRVHDLDEALRRAEAFHAAGADMLFIHTRAMPRKCARSANACRRRS
jgi:2-methylisocitrate lyase-like PEP mutase family enzyme